MTAVPPYRLERHPRKVATDCLVNLDANRYSVPWRFVGEQVEVAVIQHQVQIFHGGDLVAEHPLAAGRHQVIRQAEHYRGLFRTDRRPTAPRTAGLLWPVSCPEVEVRDLGVYEALVAGGVA